MEILSKLNTNGTGIDITQLSNDLASAEIEPRKMLVSDRIDAAELSLTGYERMRGQLEILQESMSIASTMGTINAQSSSSAVSVAMTDATRAVNISSEITVSSLAQSQVLEFAGFTGEDALVGAGTLTIDFGEWAGEPQSFTANGARSAQTITVTETTTLADLATSLNALDGVTARVVNVGDGNFSLGVVSETGAANALRFTVDPASDASLQAFDIATDPATAMIRNSSDAQLTVDGINVSRSSNEINDLIAGMTLTLEAETTGPVTVAANTDPDLARDIMESLLADINASTKLLKDLTARGFGGSESGELAGCRSDQTRSVRHADQKLQRTGWRDALSVRFRRAHRA